MREVSITSKYILTKNGFREVPDELYHHGVKGMKWGVRRYQNKDGSLTAAGKKLYESNRDSDKLASKLAKHTEDYAIFDTHTKRYYNPETGNTINRVDTKQQGRVLLSKSNYENLKNALSRKYDTVDAKSSIDYETGRATVTAILKKSGKTYMTELESTFDPVSEEYYDSLWELFDPEKGIR